MGVVMPPSKVMALVEFFEPSEARSAFRSLAHRPFKHTPLYLEWAPMDSFKEPAKDGGTKAKAQEQKKTKEPPKVAEAVNSREEVLEEEAAESSATIYVTNLNFDTTSEGLKTFFGKKMKKLGGGVRSAMVATKKSANGVATLSRGYGFVEFESKEQAHKALKDLGELTLDEHQLKMKLSMRTSAAQSGAQGKARDNTGVPTLTKGKSATKIVVRNVPFEANKKEMTALFHTFGQVKNVRMPKKFDGSHRGFAFVEFLTREEAKTAVEALAATHMYGRHLVIEYAAEDQSLEAIQDRAKRDLTKTREHEGSKTKKRKTEKSGDDDAMEED